MEIDPIRSLDSIIETTAGFELNTGLTTQLVSKLLAAKKLLQDRSEALTYVNILAACRMRGAEGTATELLNAMAAELFG